MRRPLAYFGFSFLFSLIITILTDVGLWFVLIVVTCLLLSAWFLRNKRKTTAITMVVIATSSVIAQLYLIFFNMVVIEWESNQPTGQHSLVGVVEDARGTIYDTNTLQLRITESDSLPTGRLIGITEAPDVLQGQKISCNVMIVDAGTDALEMYIDGVFLSSIYTGGLSIISEGNGVSYFFKEIQAKLTARLNPYLGEDSIGIAAAMTYGDRSGLSYEQMANFSKSGLSHILVVSGLHLSILSGLFLVSLQKLSDNKFVIYPVLIVVVILYTLLCGVRLSVIRAAFVVVMLSLSRLVGRRSDTYTSLGFAVLVVTLLNPYSSIDLSLLLSLFATIGILFGNEIYSPLHEKIKNFNRPLAYVISATITSACAIVATMPVFAALGDGVSLLAIPANLIAVLMATPIICITLVALVTTVLPIPLVTSFILSLDEFLIEVLINLSNFVAQIEWQFIHFFGSYPFLLLIVAFIAIILNIIFEKPKLAVLSGAIVILSGIITFAVIDYNTIHVAVIGQTLNPVVVITKNNNAAVIYRGTKSNNNEIERFLAKRNIRDIDEIIDISHAESSLTLLSDNTYNFENLDYYSDSFTVMEDINIQLRKQNNSNICLVDVSGYNIAISSGEADYEGYCIQDLVVAGSAKQYNIDTQTLVSRKPSVCIDFAADEILQSDNISMVWVRPQVSYIIED